MRERTSKISSSRSVTLLKMIARFETDFYNFDALNLPRDIGPRSAGHLLHH